MPECNECGQFLSTQYVKVFGDNNDEVSACPHCTTKRTPSDEARGSDV